VIQLGYLTVSQLIKQLQKTPRKLRNRLVRCEVLYPKEWRTEFVSGVFATTEQAYNLKESKWESVDIVKICFKNDPLDGLKIPAISDGFDW
jgi:hypothetical protein